MKLPHGLDLLIDMEFFVQAIVGFLAGLLGGLLGIGGSVLIIPALIVYLSHTRAGYVGNMQHLLQAAAMITNFFVAAPSVAAHLRADAVMKSVIAFLIPAALVGIALGVMLSNSSLFARQNGVYLALLLATFLVYVAAYNTWRLFSKTDMEARFDPTATIPGWKTVLVGFPMGLVAGLLGIGGGALCVPTQQLLLKIPLRRAIANSATTIVCVSCVGALYKNLTLPSHGIAIADSLRLVIMLVPTAIVGSYFGGRLTHWLPRNVLRLVFIIFMSFVAYLTFQKAWTALPTRPPVEKADGKKVTGAFCAKHPKGRSGKRRLSPFSRSPKQERS